jgi:hypothetical protein
VTLLTLHIQCDSVSERECSVGVWNIWSHSSVVPVRRNGMTLGHSRMSL